MIHSLGAGCASRPYNRGQDQGKQRSHDGNRKDYRRVEEARRVSSELAQEALIRAMDAWPRLRTMAAPGAWVHRVAMNLAKSWFRRYAAERRAVRRLPRDVSTPDPVVAAVLTVRAAVARLPERQRRCVVMRHYLGYPVDVTATTLQISEQAVASLTYRAMQSLRQHVQEDPILEEAPHGR